MENKPNVGFIGVGMMGHGMAKNILEAGYSVNVIAHRKREAVEDLCTQGATELDSAEALAESCDVIVLCVSTSDQVVKIIEGQNGVTSAGQKLTVVDCSTSDPSVTTALASRLQEHGIALVDAPLSRTPKEAWEGNLDVMIGGDKSNVDYVWPIIKSFAGNIVHTGEVGTGHTMKLLNNFLSLGYGAIYAEALMLCERAGLDPQVFHNVISGGRMDCGFYQTFMTYVLERDPNAHRFSLDNALKDTTYLNAFAQAQRVANPLSSAVRNSYASAVASGHGQDFVPMLSDIVSRANNGSPVTHSDSKEKT